MIYRSISFLHCFYCGDQKLIYGVSGLLQSRRPISLTDRYINPIHLCAFEIPQMSSLTPIINIGEPRRCAHYWCGTSRCHGMQCIGEKRGQCVHHRPKVGFFALFNTPLETQSWAFLSGLWGWLYAKQMAYNPEQFRISPSTFLIEIKHILWL